MYGTTSSYRKNNWSYIQRVKLISNMILNETSIYRSDLKKILVDHIWDMMYKIRPSRHISVHIIQKIHFDMYYQLYEPVSVII